MWQLLLLQTPLMKIRNTQAVECDLNVFEKDLAKIKVGNRVTLNLTNQPGVKLSGTVYGMNQYFNDNSKAVAVHVKLDAASVKSYLHSSSGNTHGGKLFAGMYVSGKIATGSQQCLALPSQAIVNADGKQYVFALNGAPSKGIYSFSRHEVTTGASDGKYTEVKLCDHLLKGKEHTERDDTRHHQSCTPVAQKNDKHEDNDESTFDEVAGDGALYSIHQVGTVDKRFDDHAFGQ
jgi:membrane fusion protein, heavy metal efflux system